MMNDLIKWILGVGIASLGTLLGLIWKNQGEKINVQNNKIEKLDEEKQSKEICNINLSKISGDMAELRLTTSAILAKIEDIRVHMAQINGN